MSEERITYMGIAGEFAAAKALGCAFDPFPRRGGDGHRRDLWKGGVTISVKTRHAYLDPDFICPPGQIPKQFHDDYGVVGRWIQEYDLLDLEGYFTREDYIEHGAFIAPSPSAAELRYGLDHRFFRPMEELVRILDAIHDETVPTFEAYGQLADQRYGNHSPRDTIP